MAYASKEQDHQKRRDQEGSYSLYNYMYRYLMDNFEPEQLGDSAAAESAENLLVKEGKAYSIKGGKNVGEDFLRGQARKAVASFCLNNGEHGDTAGNFGKAQSNSFDNVKRAVSDLRW